jgi:WD40 repeat protein
MSPVTSITFLSAHQLTNGPALVTAGRDKVLNVWAVRNGYKHTKTIPTYEVCEITFCSRLPRSLVAYLSRFWLC